MKDSIFKLAAVVLIAAASSPCQDLLSKESVRNSESDHLLWIIPNYRTSPRLTDYQPLTATQKFRIAAEDSWDRGTVALSAVLAAQSQLSNSNRSFGQGVRGYSHDLGTSYADFVIGNYMTEGVFPTILHQDPRYFRRGTGNGLSRLRYALAQTFVTRGDSGKIQPNYSEWLGNSTAVAISNAYYPDGRTIHDGASKLGMQIGIDAAANLLKEFGPDVEKLFHRRHHRELALSEK